MNDFIKLTENFSLSDVLFVLLALAGLILTIEKVYKFFTEKFNWFHKKKKKDEDLQDIIKLLNEQNEQQTKLIDEILLKLNALTNSTKHNMKYVLTKACEEYIDCECLTSYELKSLEDMFEIYEEIKGNSHVHTLMDKVRKLKVINSHDEQHE